MGKRRPRTVPRADLTQLADVISAKRVKKGISQRDLSRRLGIYEMAIMEFERGHRGLQVSELIDIAAILEEDPVKLLQEALGTPSE